MTKKSPSPSPNSLWRKIKKAEKTMKTSTTSQRLSVQSIPTPSPPTIADIFKIKKKSFTSGLKQRQANSKSSSTMGIGIGSAVLMRKAPPASAGPRKSSSTPGIPVMRKKFSTSRGKTSQSLDICSRPQPRIREAVDPMDCSSSDTGSQLSSGPVSLSQSSEESSLSCHSKASISNGFVRTGPILPELSVSVLRSRNEVGNTVTSTPVEASRSRSRIQDLSTSFQVNRTDLNWNFSTIQESLPVEEDLFTITKRKELPVEASPTLNALQKPDQSPADDEKASPVDAPTNLGLMEEERETAGGKDEEVKEMEELTEKLGVEDEEVEEMEELSKKKKQVPPTALFEEAAATPSVPRDLPSIAPSVGSRKKELPAQKAKKTKSVPAQEISEELPDLVSQSTSGSEEGEDSGISSVRMRTTEHTQWVSSIDCINLSVNRDVFVESVYVYKSYDLPMKNRFKLEIYHTSRGEMLLQEVEDSLRDTDIPEIGELELETALKLESGRTYTAVLETRGRKSFSGKNGRSMSCCPIANTLRHLIISYTKPSQDLLGKSE